MKKKYIIILSAIILFPLLNNYSQQKDTLHEPKNMGQLFLNDALIILDDGGRFFSSPLRFGLKEWAVTAGISFASYGLMYGDQWLNDRIARKYATSLNNDFWDIPYYWGRIDLQNILSLTTYTVGLFTRKDNVRILGRLWFQSLAYGGILVQIIRIIAGRSRPYLNEGSWEFNGPSFKDERQSFPSGHVTVAFGASTILAEYFGTIWSRIGFYGFAGLTAFSRIYNNRHWFSDIFLGAAIGIAGGLFVINQEKQRGGKNTFLSRISVSASASGLNFIYQLN